MTAETWSRQLVGGLDSLPLTRVEPVPLPADHPDHDTFDADTFDADMAAIARAGRWMWARALWGDTDARPDMPDMDLLCDFTPGCEVELFLAVDDKVTELLAGDIAQWSTEIAATTERLVAEVYGATVVA